MKPFFSAHWEKLAAALGLLLLAASLVWNLLLGGPPAVSSASMALLHQLQALENDALLDSPVAPQASKDLRALLERHPGPFSVPIPAGLVNYGFGPLDESLNLVVDDVKEISFGSRFNSVEPSEPGGSPVAKVEPLDDLRLRVTALNPGTMTVSLKLAQKVVGTVMIRVREKKSVELWPPVLQKPSVNPTQPGEVALSWSDHPRTAPQVTLGYVVERRSPPGVGEFKPLPSMEGGKMLPPSAKTCLDEVEPNCRYEYRIRAIGDASVTQVMPEGPGGGER